MNIVSRTCRPLEDGRWGERQPLAHFRSESAYVLLGDPGIGKTKSLEQEACVEGCEVTSASDFLEGEPPDEFPQPLFIDGLDEVRAGAFSRPGIAGAIRTRLQTLGMPRFRLSCRAADWLGAVDVHRLEQVAPGGQLKVLLLESLDEAGVRAILENHELIAEEFIQKAGERGVAELLYNPQTLKMLVRVSTTGGAWPQGLQETFQAACSLMSDEHSREHRAAGGSFPRAEILLDAGRLCALQLICGFDGVSLDTDDASPLYPLVDDLGDADTDALRASLSRRLFASTGRGRLIPIHRRVAEFLGARYLGQRVAQDLSARRVVALMTGEDGRVVAPLRGLAAWLAALCPEARRFAIKSDPVGVGLYGDIRNFSQDEKRLLIDVLAREAPSSLPYGVVDSGAFAPLATHDMGPVFCDWVFRNDPETESFVEFLLDVLANASPLADATARLPAMLRDVGRSMGVRRSGARCLARAVLKQPDRLGDVVRELMSELCEGRLRDPDHDILGVLLHEFYPALIAPGEVLRYWIHRASRNDLADYAHFWDHLLPEKACPADAAIVLDGLVERHTGFSHEADPPVPSFAARLVGRALEQLPPDARRLYGWLNLVAMAEGGDARESTEFAAWLSAEPAVLKELYAIGLEDRCSGIPTGVDLHLLGVSFPADFGCWCLDKAVDAAEPEQARAWFVEAWFALESGHCGRALSLEVFVEACRRNHRLQAFFEECGSIDVDDPRAIEGRTVHQRKSILKEQRERERLRRLAYFGRHEDALASGRCPSNVIRRVAEAYWGHYSDVTGESPRERVRNLVGGDAELGETAMRALRCSIHRDDLPGCEEVLGLFGRNKVHPLAWPTLASLELVDSATVVSLDTSRARSVMALGLSVHRGETAGHFEVLLSTHRTAAVTETLRFAKSGLRRRDNHSPMVYEITADPDLAELARSVVPSILADFPVRAPRRSVPVLMRLLRWGVQNLARATMSALVDRKLGTKSMTLAQRVVWLAGAVVVDLETKLPLVEVFAGTHADAMVGFFAFLGDDETLCRLVDGTSPEPVGRLIRLLASGRRPVRASESDMAGFEEATLVRGLIEGLGRRTDNDARKALEVLLDEPVMSPWRAMVSGVHMRQRALRRNALYSHPGIEAACRTLSRGHPGSARDLHALLTEAIEDLGEAIRHGPDDRWKRYWNVDGYGRVTNPRPENTCRDALVADLVDRLPKHFDVQREGQYRNGRRSDIRLATEGFNVPVEIKLDSSARLWTGLRDQLASTDGYVRDPGAGGRGIYVVMWFGEHVAVHPETHKPIDRPQLIREVLESMLTFDEQCTVAVRVIDVSRA